MDKKYKELRRNTLIIGVANLGSKAISFILAPLYSYWITVEQYGDMDLIISTVLLLTPVVCLDIYDATFRFASDSKYDNRTVLSVSLLFTFPCVALCAVISVISALILGNHLFAFSSIYLALNLIKAPIVFMLAFLRAFTSTLDPFLFIFSMLLLLISSKAILFLSDSIA